MIIRAEYAGQPHIFTIRPNNPVLIQRDAESFSLREVRDLGTRLVTSPELSDKQLICLSKARVRAASRS
jgi:hypothetical protein